MAVDLDRRGRGRRRAILAGAIFLVLVALQAVSVAAPVEAGAARAVDIVRVAAFCVLALVLALRSTTAFSFMARTPGLDDELSRENRASAARAGYLATVAGSAAALMVSLFAPVSALEILPLVLMAGVFVAAVRFALLEGRGEADG